MSTLHLTTPTLSALHDSLLAQTILKACAEAKIEHTALVEGNGMEVLQSLNRALNSRGYCLFETFLNPAAIPKSEYDLAFQTSLKKLLVRNRQQRNSGMNTHRQRWQVASLVSAEANRKALARKTLDAKWNGRRYLPGASQDSIERATNTAELRKALLAIGLL